jgi:hypothetical protein
MKKTMVGQFFTKKAVGRSLIATLLVLVMLMTAVSQSQAVAIPLTTIVSVVPGVSVTISGVNFPADQTFTVRMGAYGTLGVGGTVVGTKEPGSSTSFTATYNIPAALTSAAKIAIRFDSPQGFYSYDWFVNQAAATTPATATTPSAATTPVPGYTGIPTFTISAVQQGISVSILTKNFPAGQTFTVRMGEFGTLGLGGTVVGTLESGSGGALTGTFTIPAALASRTQIAIRLDSPLGYYSYNWFMNNANFGTSGATTTPAATATAGPTATPGATSTPAPTTTPVPSTSYTGIPTFMISSVVKDTSVTISAVNFPPSQTFTVRMGAFGTMAVGGTVVTTYDSGAGGNFSATYNIPASLAGSAKIAIRLESGTGYYYSYNWFYNN